MAQQITHHQQLANSKYRNWVKAGLGLKYLKEGIETFSNDVVEQQHNDILNTVKQKHGHSAINCGGCNLRNLQPDHVRNRNKQCPLGQPNCNCQYPGGKIICPNNVCGAIYDQIILNHASIPPNPCWRNTDAQQWCLNAWSVAKCFINASGYETKTNATEIDCTGLLHLFINSKYLQSRIQCKITGADVFSKVRSSRNAIYHSSSMELEDIEVNEHIDNMIAVLEDGKELLNREESKAAVSKLKQLKSTDFVISCQTEAQVIKDVLDQVNQKINDFGETVQSAEFSIKQTERETLEKIQASLKTKEKEILDTIQKAGNKIKVDIITAKKEAENDIRSSAQECMNALERTVTKYKAETSTEIEKAADSTIKDLKLKVKKEMEETGARSLQETRLEYVCDKADFQKRLLEMYMEDVVKVSPVLLQPDRTDTNISQLYVDPWIEVMPLKEEKTQDKENISSYRGIFQKGDKRYKLIYIVGEAGSGKSAFCINMVYNWCVAHTKETNHDLENVQEMKRFDFLFYISLRHNNGIADIETMIKTQYNDPIIGSILEKEADGCLILLDGLDEWTAPLKQIPACQFQTKGLPMRNPMKGYTVVTTSRPWKVESLCIKYSEINQKFLLRGVHDNKAMIENTVKELNEMFKTNKKKDEFDIVFSKCSIERDMKHVPFVLQQLICLWFEGKLNTFGKTKTYSNMISLLFEWTSQRNPDDLILRQVQQEEEIMMPEQLNQENKYVIYHAGKLAHATLFSEQKESSLSFDNSTFKHLDIPDEVLQCCLKTGILSKEREVGLKLSSRQHVSFTFIHKSVQEFLSAVYIYTELKKKSPELFNNCTEESFSNKVLYSREYLGSCKTVNEILEFSNVIKFLCGFETFLAANVTKFVYRVALEDERLIDFRTRIKYEAFDLRRKQNLVMALYQIYGFPTRVHDAAILGLQNTVFEIVEEAVQQIENADPIFFLADVAYKDLVTSNFELTKYVTAKYVSSISIVLPGSIRESLLAFLNHVDLGRNMSTVEIHLDDNCFEQVNVISKFLLRCRTSLKCIIVVSRPLFRYVFSPRNLLRNIIRILPGMRRLSSIQLKDIKLSTMLLGELCRFLTNATYLRQISLHKVSDEYEEGDIISADLLYIDLSHHHQLQILHHDFDTIDMDYFNVVNLETCALRILSYNSMVAMFRVLKRSRKLKHIHLSTDMFALSRRQRKVTRLFQKLLPSLKYLNTLDISGFQLYDNIISSPFKMKRLRKISFSMVYMDDDAWGKFIDSILLTPCNIQVELLNHSGDFSTSLTRKREELHNFIVGDESLRFSTKSLDI